MKLQEAVQRITWLSFLLNSIFLFFILKNSAGTINATTNYERPLGNPHANLKWKSMSYQNSLLFMQLGECSKACCYILHIRSGTTKKQIALKHTLKHKLKTVDLHFRDCFAQRSDAMMSRGDVTTVENFTVPIQEPTARKKLSPGKAQPSCTTTKVRVLRFRWLTSFSCCLYQYL